MSFICLRKLNTQRRALLEQAIAPWCRQEKRARYLKEAELISDEIFKNWRKGLMANLKRDLGFGTGKTDSATSCFRPEVP